MEPADASAAVSRPRREVIVDDALAFTRSRAFDGCSFVSSIPDVSETGMSFPAWQKWFAETARLFAEKTPVDGLLVLTQTDIRKDGRWIDKGFMVQHALVDSGMTLLARKVICRRPTGSVSSARASFTHLLVWSKGLLIEGSRPDTIPDVMPDGGNVTWTRGLGEKAALACVDLVKRYAPASLTVVDPFCGEGMVLAAANHRGLGAIGCERNTKRAVKAGRLIIKKARDGVEASVVDEASNEASDEDAEADSGGRVS